MMTITAGEIAVIGLGYVGLPLAKALAKEHRVVAYDKDQSKIEQLFRGCHQECTRSKTDLLDKPAGILLTHAEADLEGINTAIICVPTPVTKDNEPDLSAVLEATDLIADSLERDCLVILESTVAPGTTMGLVRANLEARSGLRCNEDFYLAYCPERINPGDPKHTLRTTSRVFAVSTPQVTDRVKALYQEVLEAELHQAESIEVAEFAKLLENTQRDVNIALMNEMEEICWTSNVSFQAVLRAAKTKWNFAPFSSGLVGGHCVAVDPYYLIKFASDYGVSLPLTRTAREVNAKRAESLCGRILEIDQNNANSGQALVLGLAFKADVADFRNSQNLALAALLQDAGMQVTGVEPHLDACPAFAGDLVPDLQSLSNSAAYSVIILCAAHRVFEDQLEQLSDRYPRAVFVNASGRDMPGNLPWQSI